MIVSGGVVQPDMERVIRPHAGKAGPVDERAPASGPGRARPRRHGALAMAIVTSEGIVLKTHALGETSRIAVVCHASTGW